MLAMSIFSFTVVFWEVIFVSFPFLTLGLKMIIGKCFMVACADWMFWRVQLWHVSHKCPASWTRWPLSEPWVTLRPQSHWWLLRLWFSVSTAYSLMGSWPLTRLLAAMVETKVCKGLLTEWAKLRSLQPLCFCIDLKRAKKGWWRGELHNIQSWCQIAPL